MTELAYVRIMKINWKPIPISALALVIPSIARLFASSSQGLCRNLLIIPKTYMIACQSDWLPETSLGMLQFCTKKMRYRKTLQKNRKLDTIMLFDCPTINKGIIKVRNYIEVQNKKQYHEKIVKLQRFTCKAEYYWNFPAGISPLAPRNGKEQESPQLHTKLLKSLSFDQFKLKYLKLKNIWLKNFMQVME